MTNPVTTLLAKARTNGRVHVGYSKPGYGHAELSGYVTDVRMGADRRLRFTIAPTPTAEGETIHELLIHTAY